MKILEVDILNCLDKAPKERNHQHRLQACDNQSVSHKPQGGEIHVPKIEVNKKIVIITQKNYEDNCTV